MIPKFLLLISLFCLSRSVGAQEQRKKVADKCIELFVNSANFKPKDLFGIIDAVAAEVLKNTKYDNLDFKGIVLNNGPKEKVFFINDLKMSLDRCLKDKKQDKDAVDVMNMAAPVLSAEAKPVYNQLLNMVTSGKKDGKSDSDIRPSLYKHAADKITKKVAQTLVTNAAKKLPCPIWQCVLSTVKPAITFNKYSHDKSGCASPAV